MTLLAVTLAATLSSAPSDRVDVQLDPATGRIEATAELQPRAGRVAFELHRDLTIAAVAAAGAPAAHATAPADSPLRLRHEVVSESPVQVRYAGRLTDPEGPGIGPDGALLRPEVGWYPLRRNTTVEVGLATSADWSFVAAGERLGEGRFRTSSADGLAVVATRFRSQRTRIGATAVTASFLPDDAAMLPSFLGATHAEMTTLSSLLGPYPHATLELVEGFSEHGFGYPGLLVLARGAVTDGARTLRSRHLAHELAHGWLGNHVLVDPAGGDWAEALVHYLVEHAPLGERDAATARDRRQRAVVRYSAQVTPAHERPLRTHRAGSDEIGRRLGHERAALVLHAVHERLGDQRFLAALRRLIDHHGGQRASWDDVVAELTGEVLSLRPQLDRWLDEPRLPQLELVAATHHTVGPRGAPVLTTIRLAQKTPGLGPIEVPVAVDHGGTTTIARVRVADGRGEARLFLPTSPSEVRLDPDFVVPRRLTPGAAPPSLGTTVAAAGFVAVYPSSGPSAAGLRAMAEELARAHGGVARSDADVSPDALAGPAVLLGGPLDNAATRTLLVPPRELRLAADGFVLADRVFADDQTLLLWSHRLPAGGSRSFVLNASPRAVRAPPALTPALWETVAVIERGRLVHRAIDAVERLRPTPASPPTTLALAAGDEASPLAQRPPMTPPAPARASADPTTLADEDMRLARETATLFASLGLKPVRGLEGDPWLDPIELAALAVDGVTGLRLDDGREVTVAPLLASREGTFRFLRTIVVGAGFDPAAYPTDLTATLPIALMAAAADAEQEAVEVAARVAAARAAGARALVIVQPGNYDASGPALASYPKVLGLAGATVEHDDLFLALASADLLEHLGRDESTTPSAHLVAGQLRLARVTRRQQVASVLGVLPGASASDDRGAVLLAVPVPAIGDGREARYGDDARRGIDAVLDAVRAIRAAGTSGRSLLVAALGGEDLGHLGARRLTARIDALPVRPQAVITLSVVASDLYEGELAILPGGDVELERQVRAVAADLDYSVSPLLEIHPPVLASGFAVLAERGLPALGVVVEAHYARRLAERMTYRLTDTPLPRTPFEAGLGGSVVPTSSHSAGVRKASTRAAATEPASQPATRAASRPATRAASRPATHAASRPATQQAAAPPPYPGDPLRRAGETHLRNIRQLTFGGENAEAYWSPDGRQLNLQSAHGDYTCDQIFILDVETGAKRLASTGEGKTTCSYFLPPDRIIYSSTHGHDPACPPPPDYSQGYIWPLYRFDLYTAREDGTDLVRLTSSDAYDAEATVSVDGQKVVFTSTRNGDLDIYTMNPDGSDVRQLTDTLGYDGGPFFSPDGSKIVFPAYHPKTAEETARYKKLLAERKIEPTALQIYVMDADGSHVRQVTDNGAASFAPYWHPDGERIIFASNLGDPRGRNFDLYLINADGSGQQRITHEPSFDGFPMFSPDGKRIAFASNRNAKTRGETNVFVADWVE